MQKLVTFITALLLSSGAAATSISKQDILKEVAFTQYTSVVVFDKESDRHRLYTTCRLDLRRNDRAAIHTNVSSIRTGTRITLQVNNRKQRCKVIAIDKLT